MIYRKLYSIIRLNNSGISIEIKQRAWSGKSLFLLFVSFLFIYTFSYGISSLFGDYAMHGEEGVKFYTKLKTVTSRWPKSIKDGPEFVMPTN